MTYRYGQKLKTSSNKIKKLVAGVTASIAILAGAAVPALAASNDYCGSSANGCEHSQANTVCAGHGAFGAFGKGNDWRGGASGDNTAYSNSTLCGNPQGAAGIDDPGV